VEPAGQEAKPVDDDCFIVRERVVIVIDDDDDDPGPLEEPARWKDDMFREFFRREAGLPRVGQRLRCD